MIFNSKFLLVTLSMGTGFSLFGGCSLLPGENPTVPPTTSASPAATTQATTQASPSPSPAATASPAAATKANAPAKTTPKGKPPLTVAKLKNAEYFILAEGPVTLKNGKFQDKQKRTFTLGEVVAYGDLNKDGIKDAVAPLTINIDGRDFTYLVGVLNENGNPKNTSSDFLGERVKVKTLSANAGNIEVKMDKYSPGDPECCPSVTITRKYTYKPFKPTDTTKKDQSKDKKATDQSTTDKTSTKDAKPATEASPSPSPAASPAN